MGRFNSGASRGHKYAALLPLLLVSLAIQSFDARPGAEGILSDAFRTILIVATLIVVFERPRERMVMAVIVVAAIAIVWGHHLFEVTLGTPLSLALSALVSLFAWTAVWVILRDLFQQRVVGSENVLGAISGYIIAGDAWAGANEIAYLVAPAAYAINPAISALLAHWHGRHALFSYYGFAQMLTIGYADVTPVRAPATTLSLFGTLFGLFYTAVVVSQFVRLGQDGKQTPDDR